MATVGTAFARIDPGWYRPGFLSGRERGVRATQAFVEQDRTRSSIHAMVRRHGARLKEGTPTGMVAAVCMLYVSGLLKGA